MIAYLLLLDGFQLPSLAPLVDAGGAFFCLEVFPIFIKFYGGAVFLYSGGYFGFF